MDAIELVKVIKAAAEDKKATNIVIQDLEESQISVHIKLFVLVQTIVKTKLSQTALNQLLKMLVVVDHQQSKESKLVIGFL